MQIVRTLLEQRRAARKGLLVRMGVGALLEPG